MKAVTKNIIALPLMLLLTTSAGVLLVFSAILMAAETMIFKVFLQASRSKKERWQKSIAQANVTSREVS